MRSVLENPEPLKNLASLIKAQQAFFAQAAESLASIQGKQNRLSLNRLPRRWYGWLIWLSSVPAAEVEEAAVQGEADYR